MKVYLYNNDFTAQSIRQMETIISILNCDFVINIQWKKYFPENGNLEFMDFEDFINQNYDKSVMFFNILDGYKLIKYKNNNNVYLIFRPRGLVPEESYYKRKNKFRKLVLNYVEKKVITSTDFFVFLNSPQKEHYIKKYNIKQLKQLKNYILLPNIKLSNKSLKYNNKEKNTKLKIVYSGGFSKWQNVEKIFLLVSMILKNMNNCEFTVLTFKENFNRAKQLAKEYNIQKHIKLKYVKPKDLDNELIKHDIGIIVRDNNIINITSSPFKVLDYISNGLAIIVTDNIGNQVKEILTHEYYYLLRYENGKLIYSINELSEFIENIANDDKKKYVITEMYNKYVLNLRKINFNDVINSLITKVDRLH